MDIEALILQGLMLRGMPAHVAKGTVANMIVESRLDTGINEVKPLVAGSRGGFGLNQWTGPRRRAYEAFASQQGRPLDDLDTQLDFTLHELGTTESRAANALYQTETPQEAAQVYSEQFLRPGIPHMDRRLEEANRLAGTSVPQGRMQRYAPSAPQNDKLAMMNALAQAPQFQVGQTDPTPFLNKLGTI